MYKRTYSGWQKHLDFVLLDALMLQLSYLFAQLIHAGRVMYFSGLGSYYIQVAIVIGLLNFFGGLVFLGYKNILKRSHLVELVCVVRQVVIVFLLSAFYLFITKMSDAVSRGVFLWTILLYIVLSFAARVIRKRYLRARVRRAMVVVSFKELLDEDIADLGANPAEGIHVKAAMVVAPSNPDLVSAKKSARSPDKSQASGAQENAKPDIREAFTSFDKFTEYIMKSWVDEVYIGFIDYDAVDENGIALKDFIKKCRNMGITIHIRVSHIPGVIERLQTLENVGGHTVITAAASIANPGLLLVKRLMDIAGGIVGCIITGIIFIFLAPAIYISSPGPIFFKQTRVGKNGKYFTLYKFRSMYPDTELLRKNLLDHNKMSGPMIKIENDPRIIGSGPDGTRHGLGWFIRKTSLDEFPQFFNVLKGDMSIVGTRPPTKAEFKQYDVHHKARLAAKPGITGLWQVSGRSNITDFEKVLELDMKYIENWSLMLDIKIILLTIVEVFKGEGAE